jgi:hypothetical protein
MREATLPLMGKAAKIERLNSVVMPGLDPGIHAVAPQQLKRKWNGFAGPSPAEVMAGGSGHEASA